MRPQLVRYHLYALHFLQILWNEKENHTFRQHQNSLKHWSAKSNQYTRMFRLTAIIAGQSNGRCWRFILFARHLCVFIYLLHKVLMAIRLFVAYFVFTD